MGHDPPLRFQLGPDVLGEREVRRVIAVKMADLPAPQPEGELAAVPGPRLDAGPRFLVIHYPIRLSSGLSESRQHGLRDLPEVLAVAKLGGVCLWLHGHRHDPYFFDKPAWAPFPAICAGSGTEWGIWSYNEYTVEGTTLKAVRRAFDPASHRFQDAQEFHVRLPGVVSSQ